MIPTRGRTLAFRPVGFLGVTALAGLVGLAGLGLAQARAQADEDHTTEPATAYVAVGTEPLHRVDPRLFGQFMEIASWGEPGPDALADPLTGELPGAIVEKLRGLHAGIVRYPGGTDVAHLDWRERIGPVAERPAPRLGVEHGLNNRFGYPEFLRLCEAIDAEPLIVLNFRRVLTGEFTAERVVDLVAYCNAPGDTRRAADGRAEPWGVRHWQIGNELFIYLDQVAEDKGWSEHELAERIVSTAVALAEGVRAITPDAVIVFDGQLTRNPALPGLSRLVLGDPRLRAAIDLPTFHFYAPWRFAAWEAKGVEGTLTEADPDAAWWTWTAMPAGFGPPPSRDELLRGLALADASGYARVAATEWNWNGWQSDANQAPFEPATDGQGRGLGVAGTLNGMLRHADRLVLGNQSMMLGVSWNIAAVHAEANDDGSWTATYSPMGLATALWAEHHGSHVVPVAMLRGHGDVAEVDTRINRFRVLESLPLLDAAATADGDERLALHLVHRRRDTPVDLTLDLSAWPTPTAMTLHRFDAVSIRHANRVTDSILFTPDPTGRYVVRIPPATAGVLVVSFAEPGS